MPKQLSTQLNRVYFLLSLFVSACSDDKNNTMATATLKDTLLEYFIPPTPEANGHLQANARVCYFDNVTKSEAALNLSLEMGDARENDLVKKIMGYSGLPANFSIYRGDVSNALATLYKNERLVIYNKDLFYRIDKESKSYWASIFILAHEIGHHLSFNLISSDPIQAELEADRFAATILFKMGADTAEVLQAIRSKFISNTEQTKSHPSRQDRIQNVLAAWSAAASLSVEQSCPPPPHDQDIFKELDTTKMWDISVCGDDFGPWTPEHDDNQLLKTLEIKGVVCSKKDNPNEEQLNPEHQKKASILIEIIGLDAGRENQIGLQVGEKSEFEAWYCESRVTANSNLFEEIFEPGRRIIFDAYGIAENDYFRVRIARVRTAK